MTRYPEDFEQLDMSGAVFGEPALSPPFAGGTLVIPVLNLGLSRHPLHSGAALRWLDRGYLVFPGTQASVRRVRDYDASHALIGPIRELVQLAATGATSVSGYHLEGDEGVDPGRHVLSWQIAASRFVLCVPDDAILRESPLEVDAAGGRFLSEAPPAHALESPRAIKPSLLMVASKSAGRCVDCRHANQGSADYSEGHLFCRWDSRPRSPASVCDLPVELSRARGLPRAEYFLFERFDGRNGSYGLRCDSRMMPEDASPALRRAELADRPVIGVGEELE